MRNLKGFTASLGINYPAHLISTSYQMIDEGLFEHRLIYRVCPRDNRYSRTVSYLPAAFVAIFSNAIDIFSITWCRC